MHAEHVITEFAHDVAIIARPHTYGAIGDNFPNVGSDAGIKVNMGGEGSMSDNKVLVSEKKGNILYITLNRPDVLNALNFELQMALLESFKRFRDDKDLLVAIVAGAGGRAFSVGWDLKEVARYDAEGKEERPAPLPRLAELEIWKPIVAAIDGHCLGFGLELALQCDIRVATSHSTFGLPEPRWNMIAGYYGCHNLSRAIPLGEALYMQLTGNRITGEEALRCGLVHSLHPDRDSLMKQADVIADAITLCSPAAIQSIKQVVMKCRDLPVEESYKMGDPMVRRLAQMEDAKEGPKAFTEKRRPLWKMR